MFVSTETILIRRLFRSPLQSTELRTQPWIRLEQSSNRVLDEERNYNTRLISETTFIKKQKNGLNL